MKNLYSKALQFSANGYSVIPLRKDKRPIIKEWKEFQTEAAGDDKIEQWWDTYPKSNIGIVTGKISGITVVDIDTKGDTVVPLDTFPETFTVKTPSGGYHLYYKYDESIRQTANTYPQFPHVDIRNDGGYVVGAGSDNGDGVEYEVVNSMLPGVFPQKLFGAGKKKVSRSVTEKIQNLQVMEEGDGRNNAMTSLLGTMINGEIITNYPTVKEAWLKVALASENPLSSEELDIIWNSISNVAAAQAASVKLMTNSKGSAYVNLENIRKILVEDEQFFRRVVFDEFLQKFLYRPEHGGYREMNDSDVVTLTREISVKYTEFALVSPTMVNMALIEVAREYSVDSAKNWIENIKWDGESRIDHWLAKTYNVEDNEYHKAVGSNWLKGMAGRIVTPGIQFDYVLVIEGDQGIRKSSSFGVLGGDWYVETTEGPEKKDFFMLLQGNLIIEFSEGETLSRGEIKKLKAVITTRQDKFRAPYDRHMLTHPRRCVFAMTTNQAEYLKDETGNRRWLPVAAKGEVNLEWLKDNRDQLLAEALHRIRELKETNYEFPKEIFEEQAKRQISDPNYDRVMEWYYSELNSTQRAQGVTPHNAFAGINGTFGGGKFNRLDSISMTSILRTMGLDRKQVRVQGGRVYKWYEKGAEVPVMGMTSNEVANEF